MENISNFLKAAEDYGCDRGDLFQSVNLTEGQNMQAVIQGIQALGRKVSVFFYICYRAKDRTFPV